MPDPDAVGQFTVGRVPEEQHAAAGDHRRVGFRHVELFEHLVHLRLGFEIGPGEHDPVLGQEVSDAERILRVARTDHP